MNIYEKIALARVAIHEKGMKKSGKNEFAKYDYFELSDFIPEIVKQEGLLKFCCIVTFAEVASLTIVDAEKPDDKVIFQSPMSTASLKGMHEVQNLGAVQTYIRRYLYTNAFEIVEADAIDKAGNETAPKPPKDDAPKELTISKAQIMELTKECMNKDKTPNVKEIERLRKIYTNHGYHDAKDILVKDLDQIKREFVDGALPFNLEATT